MSYVREFGSDGVFSVSRYSDIVSVLRNPAVFTNQTPTGPPPPSFMSVLGEAIAEEPELAEILTQDAQIPQVLLLAPKCLGVVG